MLRTATRASGVFASGVRSLDALLSELCGTRKPFGSLAANGKCSYDKGEVEGRNAATATATTTTARYLTSAPAAVESEEGGTKYAVENKKVHGLGRLAAKLGQPVVDVCTLQAVPRLTTNKYEVKRLRRDRLVPAVLMPVRNTQKKGTVLLTLQDREIERLLKRHKSEYAKAQLIKLVVPKEETGHFEGWVDGQTSDGDGLIHAVFRTFDFHVVTSDTLSVTLQHCPPGEQVRMRIPVSIIGEDACSAMKKNGYLYPVRPFVDCVVDANEIPPSIEYNISSMTIGNSIRIKDLEFQDGVKKLLGKSSNPQETLYKMIKL
ncbi:ribosomal protein L25 [Chloropicon primus]|uniref:Ribosomal protein L25 n=1 Tax=Chloropicon primus TaxID=1764295 RepID=A0A5B8MS21_9CHLO|nr:ribosomal protein L25 [Chloropicon primus]UPR02730.1 ribosomal protein L25 [Chloropicon primus]|mmetsp:Transcript_7162/g.20878  ORF Transcript_7162/g.20878 Transcript_7162/m.20878 type:complete len:319 (-) Transcript_7162:736-1692(-)|eukprot:QDZ23518.1 ribosomal protein L25 [Chloropicon primus]